LVFADVSFVGLVLDDERVNVTVTGPSSSSYTFEQQHNGAAPRGCDTVLGGCSLLEMCFLSPQSQITLYIALPRQHGGHAHAGVSSSPSSSV
jgi:hypothetical protein